MAVKKKKKEAAPPVKKKSRKPVKKTKKASKPSISIELKKGITALVVLVLFIAAAAMVADFYLGDPGPPTKPTSRETMGSPPGDRSPKPPPLAMPAQTVDHDNIHTKKPLQGLRQKPQGGDGESMDGAPSSPGPMNREPVADSRPTSSSSRKEDKPVYEVFETDQVIPGRGDTTPIGKEGLPLVAIIIDDVGFDKAMAMAFARLDSHITLSILPASPFGKVIANRLYVRNTEIMLHLPMEPMQYPEVDPGPGALMADMPPDQLLETLRRNLDSIPHVKGVNNHMGSRLTTLSDQMRQVFTVLKKRDLFFIDSVTAAHSMCGPSARLFRLPFAQRDVFLDNVQNSVYITRQIKELIRIGQLHGTAIGIGHPYSATLQALMEMLPELQRKVRIVRASALVTVSG